MISQFFFDYLLGRNHLLGWYNIFIIMAFSALLFGGYWLLMRREKRHQMVRFYLLGSLLLSLLAPVAPHIYVSGLTEERSETEGVSEGFTVLFSPSDVTRAEGNAASPAAVTPATDEGLDHGWQQVGYYAVWQYILWCVYLAVGGLMLILLLVRLARLIANLHQLDFTPHEGYRMAMVEGNQPAFSFFKAIVIGKNGFNEAEIEQLVGHELVHVRQCHTLDILFCEVLKVLFWFNPFVWLTERELKRVHEYQADEQMMSGKDAATYSELLYHQLTGRRYSTLGNNFDYRITKKRIAMMQQQKKRFGSLSLLVVLPVVALIIFVNCQPRQGLSGTFYVSNMYLTNDDAANTELQCGRFLNLEDRTFTFHSDGTVKVHCKADKSVDFKGTYTLDKEGLQIFDASGKPWIRMNQVTDYHDNDSISITLSDPDPMRGLETMVRTLSINKRPTQVVYVSDATYATDSCDTIASSVSDYYHNKIKQSEEKCDTIFPTISIITKDYDYMVNNGWFFNNRMLRTSVREWRTITGVDTEPDGNDGTVQYFYSAWEYPEGKLPPEARINYDTVNQDDDFIHPKRDDYQFRLRVELKRK